MADALADLVTSAPAPSAPEPDRLLTVAEAAARLSTSEDWLYRNAGKLPFAIRLTPQQLRFSAKGIERWIRLRCGTAHSQ